VDGGPIPDLTPGFSVVPVRTPTLPPATHTNTWIVGEGDLAVFDPASPWEDEQRLLAAAIDARIARGERVAALVLTHHHADHVGGARALADHLQRTTGVRPPIVAHPANRAWTAIPIDEDWDDGCERSFGPVTLRAWFTPGHAPGHLVFHDAASGTIVAGDLVAGIGTIAISPIDGDLGQYLDSLERTRALGGARLLPAHGPVLADPETLLSFYVAHRHQRSDQIRAALAVHGRSTAVELFPRIYPDLPAIALPLGAAQITSHLRWLRAQGLVAGDDAGWTAR
jgi:endoribonuclease LACTB2